jgi:hypothetical protein
LAKLTVRIKSMIVEMWLPTLVCIVIVDLVVVAVWLAAVTDQQLIGTEYRWRFGLKTLLLATAMVAINTAAIAAFFFGRMH